MSERQGVDQATPPSRVLVLEGPSTSSMVEALREEGESVTCVAGLAELNELVARGPAPDAVVLDLTGPAGTGAFSGAASPRKGVSRKPARSNQADADAPATQQGGAPPPFVLAITPAGERPAQATLAGSVNLSVCVPAEDAGRALREVRGALALRRLAEVMVELERLRSAVLHARRTAHDLAQPLTTIMARAQLLAGKLKPDDPHARPVTIICEESEKLANLIEQFQKIKVIAAGPGKGLD